MLVCSGKKDLMESVFLKEPKTQTPPNKAVKASELPADHADGAHEPVAPHQNATQPPAQIAS